MTRAEQDRSGINQPGRSLAGEGKRGKDRYTTGQEMTGLIP
jgi:hypothetical protein